MHRAELRRILQELEEQQVDDKKADKADVRRDNRLYRAVVAIGRITFARFDNVDQQLDRIEEAIKHIVESSGDQASIDALTERLQAADARFDEATGD